MPGFQEATVEQIQPESVIVIHPGSQNLRIGRASDPNPYTILHAIGRRRLRLGQKYEDSFLPPAVPRTKELLQELEDARLQISHTLQSSLQSDGRRRYATPPQQIAAFNKRSYPEPAGVHSGDWATVPQNVSFVVGNDVLKLSPFEKFNIHFPMRRGDLNVHSGPGGSLTAVLADLHTIWGWAIQHLLDIPLLELKNYRAVLIIPDIYNRQYLKELTTLLLCTMGFGGCFLIQDHVAATFGAGAGYACVVDVGDQKTSVSCVEDGVSHASTRIRMDYGGGDITQTFLWLLQKCAFPYQECNPSNRLDALLLQEVKESFCHVDLNICGSQEKLLIVKHPKLSSQQYTLQVGDECIIAPLSLFTPELLGVTGPKLVHGQRGYAGDPEDPHDGSYLRETSRRGAKESLEASLGGVDGLGSSSQLLSQLDMSGSIEEDIVVDALDSGIITTSMIGAAAGGRDIQESCFVSDQLIGFDQAVVQSIERCPSEDLKKKMYTSILIVGGGMKFKGISTWLQSRFPLQIPCLYRTSTSNQGDIFILPKHMDPQTLTWKGAAIMVTLETVQELWIKPKEWEDIGVKILRERAAFLW